MAEKAILEIPDGYKIEEKSYIVDRETACRILTSDKQRKFTYAKKLGEKVELTQHINICPVCGRQMLGSRWFAQPGHRYMDLATCADHGKFLIRVRLSTQPDSTIRVSRLTYEATSEAAEAYARRAQKAEPEAPSRPRRRRRRGGAKKEAEKKQNN